MVLNTNAVKNAVDTLERKTLADLEEQLINFRFNEEYFHPFLLQGFGLSEKDLIKHIKNFYELRKYNLSENEDGSFTASYDNRGYLFEIIKCDDLYLVNLEKSRLYRTFASA